MVLFPGPKDDEQKQQQQQQQRQQQQQQRMYVCDDDAHHVLLYVDVFFFFSSSSGRRSGVDIWPCIHTGIQMLVTSTVVLIVGRRSGLIVFARCHSSFSLFKNYYRSSYDTTGWQGARILPLLLIGRIAACRPQCSRTYSKIQLSLRVSTTAWVGRGRRFSLPGGLLLFNL